MKVLLAFWILSVESAIAPLSFAQGAQPAQSAKPLFSITICADQDIVKAGAPISIQVTRTNTSDHVLNTTRAFKDPIYRYVINIRDGQGKAAPELEWVRAMKKERSEGQVSGGSFEGNTSSNPGEAEQERIELSAYYDLSRPGRYTIKVQQGSVESNTITVTVNP